MGQANGFMAYRRETPPERPPLRRITDYEEIHGQLPDERRAFQGARCMDCGIPFCQSGILVRGAVSGCPLHNLIPEWNDLVCRGLWREAWLRLMKTNNFPEFTGRVCPAPCEGACTAGLHDPPVAIKNNECHIIDKAYAEGWMQPRLPQRRSGKHVAVVGSGPAGLACADTLNQAGHQVTVYERADRIGGLLAYGIPNMKLDKQLLARRVALMAQEGVIFLTGCEIGRDRTLDQLRRTHDAVVLCAGASKPRDLAVEGRDLQGVCFAVDYLSAATRSFFDNQSGAASRSDIDARGLDVLVVGGGDTGTDCVATAIRQGCRSVSQVEIMPCPPGRRPADNPWPQYPRVLRTDYGQEEAQALFGKDPREYLATVTRLEGDAAGHVATAHIAAVAWETDGAGRRVCRTIPGSGTARPAQLVLLAMGFLGPDDRLFTGTDLERDSRSTVKTPDSGYATSQPGVFAAGDMRRGQSLVVWAIEEGRQAASACGLFLSRSDKCVLK